MTQIQLFKPIFATEEILEEIRDCLDKSWTGLGYKTIEFENEFKKYTGLPNAHFLNSATSGLHLALELTRRHRGRKLWVVTTPLTFISTSHVISHAGHEPWFCDIDESLTLDPVELEKVLSKNRNDILAVIFVAVGGNIGNYHQVLEICKKYSTPLILDAAHAMGTYIGNRHIGHDPEYTVFSFQSVKNLPTADSGMLCCKFPGDDKLARKLSWLGIDKDTYSRQTSGGNWDYDVVDIGYKYHGNSIMAAIGIVQLKYLQNDNNIRRFQAFRYSEKLNSGFYMRIPLAIDCISSQHLYQLRVNPDHRDNLIKYAHAHGIQLGVHYKSNTEYNMYIGQRSFVPKATRIWKELISLPIGPHLTEKDVEKIIEVLNEYTSDSVA